MFRTRTNLTILVLLAVGAATLAVLGTLDIPRIPVFGYKADELGSVAEVDPESAADDAGLRVGDRISTLDGEPFDTTGRRRAVLARAGDARTLEILRDGERQTLSFEARRLPVLDQRLGVATGLSSLLFIFGGIAVFWRSGSPAAALLAAIGLSFGVAQGFRPLASTPGGHEMLDFVYVSLGALCTPLLVHLGLIVPRRRAAADSRLWISVLWLPPVLGVLIDAIGRLRPDVAEVTAVWHARLSLGGLIFLVHLTLWMLLLAAGYVQTSVAERRRRGVGVLWWGSLAAILPIVAVGIAMTLFPGLDASRLQLAFVPSLALPVVLIHAVWRYDSAERDISGA
ncbi:MAG: PDZ domain-containing protein [Acidobacteriota bacterium]